MRRRQGVIKMKMRMETKGDRKKDYDDGKCER